MKLVRRVAFAPGLELSAIASASVIANTVTSLICKGLELEVCGVQTEIEPSAVSCWKNWSPMNVSMSVDWITKRDGAEILN